MGGHGSLIYVDNEGWSVWSEPADKLQIAKGVNSGYNRKL